jgi:hypothetical protein
MDMARIIDMSVENLQSVEPAIAVDGQQTYRGPEVVELGQAKELLQGGACIGRDHAWATYC